MVAACFPQCRAGCWLISLGLGFGAACPVTTSIVGFKPKCFVTPQRNLEMPSGQLTHSFTVFICNNYVLVIPLPTAERRMAVGRQFGQGLRGRATCHCQISLRRCLAVLRCDCNLGCDCKCGGGLECEYSMSAYTVDLLTKLMQSRAFRREGLEHCSRGGQSALHLLGTDALIA
jgi:hypothetical protein